MRKARILRHPLTRIHSHGMNEEPRHTHDAKLRTRREGSYMRAHNYASKSRIPAASVSAVLEILEEILKGIFTFKLISI